MKLYRIRTPGGQIAHATGENGGFRRVEGDVFGDFRVTDEPVDAAAILAPLARPPGIYAIGLNYRAHAAETGKELPTAPVVFAKSPTSVIGDGEAIRLPAAGPACVDYEVELALVIGRECRDVPAADAREVLLGCTVACDVSARDWQKRLGQWVRAKSFDTFCPLGPCIDTEIDPADLPLRSILNGTVMQESRTSDLIFPAGELIEFLSADLTLPAGTVILTGTPSGVGVARDPRVFLRDGDELVCQIDGIGRLTHPIRLADNADPNAPPADAWGA